MRSFVLNLIGRLSCRTNIRFASDLRNLNGNRYPLKLETLSPYHQQLLSPSFIADHRSCWHSLDAVYCHQKMLDLTIFLWNWDCEMCDSNSFEDEAHSLLNFFSVFTTSICSVCKGSSTISRISLNNRWGEIAIINGTPVFVKSHSQWCNAVHNKDSFLLRKLAKLIFRQATLLLSLLCDKAIVCVLFVNAPVWL